MDEFDILIRNGVVVTAAETAAYDISVKDGKIALLAPPGVLSRDKAKRVIDAEGGYVTVSLAKARTTNTDVSSRAASTATSTWTSRLCSEATDEAQMTSRRVSATTQQLEVS
jgi:dihydroorotase-like cyclic amidohydrolase